MLRRSNTNSLDPGGGDKHKDRQQPQLRRQATDLLDSPPGGGGPLPALSAAKDALKALKLRLTGGLRRNAQSVTNLVALADSEPARDPIVVCDASPRPASARAPMLSAPQHTLDDSISSPGEAWPATPRTPPPALTPPPGLATAAAVAPLPPLDGPGRSPSIFIHSLNAQSPLRQNPPAVYLSEPVRTIGRALAQLPPESLPLAAASPAGRKLGDGMHSRMAPRDMPSAAAAPSPVPSPGAGRPPATPAPTTKLLAVSPALPPAMRRPVWRLEDFALQKRLYKGATSAVYKGSCQHSGLAVAAKVYFLEKLPWNTVHMLKREIEIHTNLVHKNVLQLYGAFMDEKHCVLVMEHAGRGDLYSIMKRVGRMAPAQVAETVLRPFLEALAYLHSRGICHRDIKPENILFTHDWRLVVADFGVSIDLNQERAVTRAGTEGYMAPEVERCPLKADPQENKDKPELAYSTAVDIWATGVLAYELLCGFPPAVCPAEKQHNAFMRDEMMAATALRFPASVPAPARDFIASALAPQPNERPTAAQLLRHKWLQDTAAAAAAAASHVAALATTP